MAKEETDIKLIDEILKRQVQLEDIRKPHEGVWDDIGKYGCMRRTNWTVSNLEAGKQKGEQIFDGTPASALKLWADGIQGYHISRALEWFSYRIGGARLKALNDVKEVQMWLQELAEVVYWVLNQSNFYEAMGEFLLDGGSGGNANMFIDEVVGQNLLAFLVYHPRELWFGENHLGQIDVVHRKFGLTARQAIQKFGKDNLSPELNQCNERGNVETKFEFLQAIYPRTDYLVAEFDVKKKSKFYPVLSYYIEVGKKILVKRGGFSIFNPIVWRMQKYSGEVYGRGLLGDAICEVKRLNSAGRTMMETAQLSAEPPMNIPQEMRDDVDLTPHGLNYYKDASRTISPIAVGVNYPIGIDYLKHLEEAIERHFQVEFFLMLARAEGTKTATEIIEMQGEKVALMSSQLGQLNKSLNAIHDRILNLLYKAGQLPPAPPVILQATGGFLNIDIDYIGPLAEAQRRLFKARSIRQSLEIAAPYVQILPGMLDNIDPVLTGRELFVQHGMPPKLLRPIEIVEEIGKQRAEQERQAFEAEMAEKKSKVVQKLQKPVEEGSIMEKMLEGA